MKLIDIVKAANANLLRNKARTILTVIAIIIGSTTLSLTNGIGSGIKSYLTKQVGNLGNNHSLSITAHSQANRPSSSDKGLTKYVPGQKKLAANIGGPGVSLTALTQKDLDKIKSLPGITSVQPDLSVTPDYIASQQQPNSKFQFVLTPVVGNSSLDLSSGQNIDNSQQEAQITIPSDYLGSLNFKSEAAAVGKTVLVGLTDATGQQQQFAAKVVGVQQKTLVGSTSAYANSSFYQALYSFQSQGLPASTKDSYISASAIYKTNLSDAQVNSLKSSLSRDGYDAKTIQDQVGIVFTIIDSVTYVLDGFAAITLLAAAFGIINTLYMSVSERTKEIGLMKALGMSKPKIFLLFSIEAILIGFWGSLIGVGIANLIGRLVNAVSSRGFLKDFTGLHLLSFPWQASAYIIVGIMLIAFLAGSLPARRASRKDPIEALRYE
ncbi:MAG: FtsX-like permease family protein [Candidatus Saccharimonadales bacterium]